MSRGTNIQDIETTDSLFPAFRLLDVPTARGTIRVRLGGEGPPLLLLHGYPQTHHLWHRVADMLRNRFTLICADLRGYGASYRPPVTPDHEGHSKRAMAAALVDAMQELGHERWMVGPHDRGARVAHRMALDHEERVTRLAVLDIAPTREMYRGTTEAFARAYWHWFFLIQSPPLPERMIAADPDGYWLARCVTGRSDVFDPGARAAYLDAFRGPAVTQASCGDYRTAATIDIAHDDEQGGRKLSQPRLALWGEFGVIEQCFDALALWRERAEIVWGWAVPSGHYLAEECPEEVARAFQDFLRLTPAELVRKPFPEANSSASRREPSEQAEQSRLCRRSVGSNFWNVVEDLQGCNGRNYFLSATAGRRPVSGFSKAKARRERLPGMPRWTFHDFRRSVAAHMARPGIPQEYIERVLGHTIEGVAGTNNRYSYLAEKRTALERRGSH